jgi:hypothetical protein
LFAFIFSFTEKINKGSPPSSRRRQRSSALHLDFQVLCPSKKSNTEWCWTFLAGALGLEFPIFGIYDIFETFIYTKFPFCIKYSNISNWYFYPYPVKGSHKGKNKGNHFA